MAIDLESGSSQWLDMGLDLAALNGKAGCTEMAWINPESIPFTATGVMSVSIGPPPGTSSNARTAIQLLSATARLRARTRDTDGSGGVNTDAGSGTISTATWSHVAITVNIPGDLVVFYLDGTQVASLTRSFSASAYSATNSKCGAIGADDDGSANYFDGQFADVRIYDRILTAIEIMGIATARGADANFYGLQHRWNLNELSPGTTATAPRDSAVQARTLTPVASPVYSAHPIRCRRAGYL